MQSSYGIYVHLSSISIWYFHEHELQKRDNNLPKNGRPTSSRTQLCLETPLAHQTVLKAPQFLELETMGKIFSWPWHPHMEELDYLAKVLVPHLACSQGEVKVNKVHIRRLDMVPKGTGRIIQLEVKSSIEWNCLRRNTSIVNPILQVEILKCNTLHNFKSRAKISHKRIHY